MKKNLVLNILLFVVCTQYFYPQNVSINSVVDAESNALLNNVSIKFIKTDSTFITINGTFSITKTGVYIIKKQGYIPKTLNLKTSNVYKILLQKKVSKLNEVLINANYIPIALKAATYSVGLITQKDIERSNTVNINEAINRIPGVFMQTGALNTNRITIRGIGSRTLFGTSKIRAYYNHIPLTNGSGETSLEDFELGAISRIQITKGATSSIYGAGLGGVIQLIPKKAYRNSKQVQNETTIGSFGLIKNLTEVGYSNTKHNIKLAYSSTHSNGYRDNNNYNRQTVTLSSNHNLSLKSELSFLGLFSNLKAFIPSSLNETAFRNNPKSAAFTWAASRGFEDTKRGILGISLKHNISPKLLQNTSVFTSFRNSFEPRPFNILDENVFGYGFRHSLNSNFSLFKKTAKWVAGIEFFKDIFKHQTFENLFEDFPEGTGSVQGEPLSNFREKRQYYNVFVESRYNLSAKVHLVLGANYNQTKYNLNDRFISTEENPDQSGNFEFKGIFSPKIGVLLKANQQVDVFSNISHGFSPLTLEEVLLPNGQINNNLKPETGWNFEIGARGVALHQKLVYSISIYRLAINNLLVARRTDLDQFLGINAGKTTHDGLEADINYTVLQYPNLQLSVFGTLSYNNYKFKDFIDGDENFSGNKLTGVPSEVFNLGVDFNTAIGIYGNLNHQYVGSIPITDSNALFSDNYTLSNIKVGYRNHVNSKIKFNIFLGINNAFNQIYASQILINARGFGGNAPRFFYPGNPINYYSGVVLNYSF